MKRFKSGLKDYCEFALPFYNYLLCLFLMAKLCSFDLDSNFLFISSLVITPVIIYFVNIGSEVIGSIFNHKSKKEKLPRFLIIGKKGEGKSVKVLRELESKNGKGKR